MGFRCVNGRLGRCAIAGLFLLAILMQTSAQSLPSMQYPWDQRPPKCTLPELAPTATCAHEDWPSYGVAINHLEHLVNVGGYALLERALTELATSDQQFSNGFPKAGTVWWGIRRMTQGMDSKTPESNKLRPWTAAVPHSNFVVIGEAQNLYDQAWGFRGEGVASTVSPEAWKLFHRKLREAEDLLLAAPQLTKDTPVWHFTMLYLALNSPELKTKPDALFQDAIKRWPRHFPMYELVLGYQVPKWGGSWQKVDLLVDHWSRGLAATEGDSVYARLYVLLFQGGDDLPKGLKMNWQRMKTSLEDLIKRYPEPYFKNVYAGYACKLRDKAAFAKAIGMVPKKDVIKEGWFSGHPYEACMLWAAT